MKQTYDTLTLEQLDSMGLNQYQACVMTAILSKQIQEQKTMNLLELKQKPTTIAMNKLANKKLVLIDSSIKKTKPKLDIFNE